MTQGKSLPVVLYARVSKADDRSHSLKAQLAAMRSYARLYKLLVIEEVCDDGQSGKDLDRPGIARVRTMLASGEARAVVVLKLDRLTRSVVDLGTLLDEFAERDIALMSVQEKLDTATAGGRFTVGILALVSQWEREVIGERTRAALVQARRDGKRVGKPPFGFAVVEGRLERDEAQQKALRKMRRLRKRGCSLRTIADELERDGVRTADGKERWQPTTIARVLAA